ncbi:CCA tRNA nucleotidyltransferase [Vagococcus sp.]|uniref:CCA tRNA nucleotidyltransferase n=1 Tax=Vagococcus sp. TaxID=1933889 RepID=UPI003F9C9675
MTMKKKLPLDFEKAIPVMKRLIKAGYEAYFVGGSVRDIILEHAIHDVDIATSAYPSEIKAIFNKTIDVGIEHGTVLVLWDDEEYEITTFRTESTYQDFRRPDKVTFVRSLEEDLKRRDFTMNALAMTIEGNIIDQFEGISSIHQREIRAVGNAEERFFEDALRMMRALRFASQLDFTIETETLEAIKKNAPLLSKISVERIYIEWVKLLLGENRQIGLALFIQTGCFKYCPGLAKYEKGLKAFQSLKGKQWDNEVVAWVLLLNYLDVNNLTAWLKQWKVSNKLMMDIITCLSLLMQRKKSVWTIDMLYQATPGYIHIVELACYELGLSSVEEQTQKAYQALSLHSIKDLAVTGKDIMTLTGLKGGKWLGDLLKKLEQEVLHQRLQNKKEVLLAATKDYLDR